MKLNSILNLALLLPIIAISNSCESAPIVCSWSHLQEELKPWAEKDVSLRSFESSESFKSIARTKDRQLFLEMSAQHDYPLVAVGGFFCLKEQFPEDTLQAGMEIILESSDPATPLFAPVYAYLQDEHEDATFRKALSVVSIRPPLQSRNYLVLVLSLPYNRIYNWYNDNPRPQLSALCEAAVLDRLYSDLADSKKPVTKIMSAELLKLGALPGIPQAVYALYTTAPKERVMESLECILKDDSIDEMVVIAVVKRRAALVREISMVKLGLSSKRRSLIQRTLDGLEKR